MKLTHDAHQTNFLEGTDRNGARLTWEDAGPKLYLPYVTDFLQRNPGKEVYIATDDSEYARIVSEEWPEEVRAQVRMRSIKRAGQNQQLFGSAGACVKNCVAGKGDEERLNEGMEVLLDVLILASCSEFVHGISGVSRTVRLLVGEGVKATNVEEDKVQDYPKKYQHYTWSKLDWSTESVFPRPNGPASKQCPNAVSAEKAPWPLGVER